MPTALEYLHSIAEKAGRFDLRTTTSAGSTTSLVCSDFISTIRSASEWANAGILIESGCCAGETGMLTNSGLAKSTGTLTTADTFTAAIASGVVFSLYAADRLPPSRKGDVPGYLQMLNQGLQRSDIEDTLSITGVDNQIHYTVDTATYPWWTDDTRIIDIQYPVTNADYVPRIVPRSAWSWVSDGETRRLRFPGAPFRTGESFTVKLNRPSNSRLLLNASVRAVLSVATVGSVVVNAGGYYTITPTIAFSGGGGSGAAGTAVLTSGVLTSVTVTNAGSGYTSVPVMSVTRNASDSGWADQSTQTAGLATLTDQAIPDVKYVRAMGLACTYEALAEMGAPGATVGEWLGKAQRWEGIAVSLKWDSAPQDRDSRVARLRPTAVWGRPRRDSPFAWGQWR